MRYALPALFLLLANQAGAQSFVSMGRLFTTPSERAQLDAQRGQAPQPAAPAAAAGQANVPAPAGMSASMPCPSGGAGGCPAAPVPDAGTPAQSTQQEDPGLRLDGVIRRSHGPATLIVNGEVQPAPAGTMMRGTVTLQADGHSVVLKPGQRYDPATGEIREDVR